jgi:hypothetical protein
LDPFPSQVVLFWDPAVLDQNHDCVIVRVSLCADPPGILRNSANPHLTRVHEIGGPLHVNGSAVEIIRQRRERRSGIVDDEFGKDFTVSIDGLDEEASAWRCVWSGMGRPIRFHSEDGVVTREGLKGKQAQVKRPVP